MTAANQLDDHHVPVNSTPGTGRRLAISVIVLTLALGLTVLLVHVAHVRSESKLDNELREEASRPASVDVVRVHYAAATRLLALPGDVGAFYQTTLYARTSGYLKKWYFDIGDHVKAGQVLADIESPDIDDQRSAAQAKLTASQADVRVSQAALVFAKTSFQRWSTAEEGVVSQQERDEKKSALDSAAAKLEYARAQITLNEAEVQRLNTLVKFEQVVAPFDGTITQRHVDIGDLVTAGSTTNTSPLFAMAQADQVRVFVNVPQNEVGEIKVGMQASIGAHQYPGRAFAGKVDRTANAIDPASKTLKVEVLVPNPDQALIPGMYVDVSFETNMLEPPLRIPAAALTMRSGGPHVAVVAPDGKVAFRKIQISRDLGDFIEVQSGLTRDDRVALNISSEIADGDSVTPVETAPAAASKAGAATASAVIPAK